MTHLKYSALMIAVVLITGCSTAGQPEKKQKTPATQKAVSPTGQTTAVQPAVVVPVSAPVSPVPQRQASLMDNCSRELKALKRLDNRQYTRRRAQFDRLMRGASVYAGVRGDVAEETREAVDAMYRYRTGKLCAEISQDVLEALSRQGENGLSGNRQ
ncbi:hypothetical protein HIX98_004499 [Salmonella enterica subsp. enterica serovar Bredeney]|nr:hypothetical protein [Salmonella enterica subsp. enterica serovar Bredeney]EHS1318926.1 hypothetical protein [Salmonella enterica subsp. enterica serovar Reading]MJU56999.1 hypothetical protein [Salmonella enterica subsp. enterica serovar Montevideo]